MEFSRNAAVTCQVCRNLIMITDDKLDKLVVKCEACNEATPIKTAPPGKKYIRCVCNSLLTATITATRIGCPRASCRRILSMSSFQPMAVTNIAHQSKSAFSQDEQVNSSQSGQQHEQTAASVAVETPIGYTAAFAQHVNASNVSSSGQHRMGGGGAGGAGSITPLDQSLDNTTANPGKKRVLFDSAQNTHYLYSTEDDGGGGGASNSSASFNYCHLNNGSGAATHRQVVCNKCQMASLIQLRNQHYHHHHPRYQRQKQSRAGRTTASCLVRCPHCGTQGFVSRSTQLALTVLCFVVSAGCLTAAILFSNVLLLQLHILIGGYVLFLITLISGVFIIMQNYYHHYGSVIATQATSSPQLTGQRMSENVPVVNPAAAAGGVSLPQNYTDSLSGLSSSSYPASSNVPNGNDFVQLHLASMTQPQHRQSFPAAV